MDPGGHTAAADKPDPLRGLIDLQRRFQEAEEKLPRLEHWLLVSDRPMDEEQWGMYVGLSVWSRFAGAVDLPDGDERITPEYWSEHVRTEPWQRWVVFPDGRRCSCFLHTIQSLPQFEELAGQGLALLAEAGRAARPGARVSLPPESGTQGWIRLVYETIRIPPRRPERDHRPAYGLPPDNTGPVVTLFRREVYNNLFWLSAEAIWYWLEGGEGRIGSPVDLPRVVDQADRDAARLEVPEEATPVSVPVWDEGARELRWGTRVLKKYRKQPAERQTAILAAFQKAGWPPAVVNPLVGAGKTKRLGDAIEALNVGLEVKGVIRFFKDGRKDMVAWERVQAEEGRSHEEGFP